MKKQFVLIFIAFLFFGKANAQIFNNIVNYSLNGTPVNGVKIKTNLPFTTSSQMPTIVIEGYNYGTTQTIGLQISYYIFNRVDTPTFINPVITSYGTYAPPVTLANEGGKLVIFINDKPYYQRFTVSAFAKGLPADDSTSYAGWTVADEALTGTPQVLLAYSNNFTGTVKMPGAGIWNSLGRVGIGTITPAGRFQVQSASYDLLAAASSVDIGLNSDTAGWARAFRVVNTSNSNGQDGGAFGERGTGTVPTYAYMSIPTADATGYNSTKILVLNNVGNVGIGTRTPHNTLDVNGTVHSKQVNVDLSGWSDYVFNKDYHLPTLTETEAYINQNHHLAEIPSAAEITKNGLDLVEMNKLLLKKVEELTLYLIEKDKQISTQQKQLDQEETKFNNDEERLNKLEKQLKSLSQK